MSASRSARHVVAVALFGLVSALVMGSCGPAEKPKSEEDCKKSSGCRSHGRCAFDRKTEKCIVGTDADCAQSTVCSKDLLCKKKGDACEKE